jgi:hypothetical protein
MQDLMLQEHPCPTSPLAETLVTRFLFERRPPRKENDSDESIYYYRLV